VTSTDTSPVLTTRELNRALLARQQLLERAPATVGVAGVLQQMAALQAQYAPSMYVGLWSRLDGFRRDDLTRLLEQREVVQGTLLRTTIHLVSRADYWPFAIATRKHRRAWWLRTRAGHPSERDMAAGARRLRQQLARGATLRRSEIEALLGRDLAAGVGLWLDLVRVPPSGTWQRRRADLYAAAEDWIGPTSVTPGAALVHVVRRYLGGFGPAAPADIAGWAGVAGSAIAGALRRLPLRHFSDERGRKLVDLADLPGSADVHLPDADTPAPVRFLPTWDATLLVHARRSGILPEEHRTRIFHIKNPQSESTFLVDGKVAGAWRHDNGRILVEPFTSLGTSARRHVDDEAERLAELFADP
jgi:Winged helix DNA-binding domain